MNREKSSKKKFKFHNITECPQPFLGFFPLAPPKHKKDAMIVRVASGAEGLRDSLPSQQRRGEVLPHYAICICSSHILTMGKFSSRHCSCMLNHVVPKKNMACDSMTCDLGLHSWTLNFLNQIPHGIPTRRSLGGLQPDCSPFVWWLRLYCWIIWDHFGSHLTCYPNIRTLCFAKFGSGNDIAWIFITLDD